MMAELDALVARRSHPDNCRTRDSRRDPAARAIITRSLEMTTEDAVAWLTAWRWPDGRVCPRCGDAKAYRVRLFLHGATAYRCKWCRCTYTWSSGTALGFAKMRPQIYVAAIESVRSRMVSANFFAAETGVTIRAVVPLFQKIRSEPNKEINDGILWKGSGDG